MPVREGPRTTTGLPVLAVRPIMTAGWSWCGKDEKPKPSTEWPPTCHVVLLEALSWDALASPATASS